MHYPDPPSMSLWPPLVDYKHGYFGFVDMIMMYAYIFHQSHLKYTVHCGSWAGKQYNRRNLGMIQYSLDNDLSR